MEIRCCVAIDMQDGKVRTQNLIGGMRGQETIGKFKTIKEAKEYYEKDGFNVYCCGGLNGKLARRNK